MSARIRIPRQGSVAATCSNPACPHQGISLAPSMDGCSGCGRPLAETRAVVTS